MNALFIANLSSCSCAVLRFMSPQTHMSSRILTGFLEPFIIFVRLSHMVSVSRGGKKCCKNMTLILHGMFNVFIIYL